MINREDSVLIARERQNRTPVTGPVKSSAPGAAAKPATSKPAAQDAHKKMPLRAGKSSSGT